MKTRILSGAVIIILLVAFLCLGGWFLYGGMLLVSLIGMYEMYKVRNMQRSSLAILGYLSAITYYILIEFKPITMDMFFLIASFIAIMTAYVITFPKYNSDDAIWAFMTVIYVAVFLSYIYQLREAENGIYLVWLIFIASWGNDTCAYFAGVALGKHKMTPKLSPKKTWEGFIGGIVGVALIGTAFGYVIKDILLEYFAHPIWTCVIACVIGALLSVVGDLTASAIKRNHNIKDYGNLIPGHGGIIDRFDSVIFTAPVVYWATVFMNTLFTK